MNIGWIYKDGHVIELPSLSAVVQKEGAWYVSTCPELGVTSQGKTRKEAYAMLAEAVELWLARIFHTFPAERRLWPAAAASASPAG